MLSDDSRHLLKLGIVVVSIFVVGLIVGSSANAILSIEKSCNVDFLFLNKTTTSLANLSIEKSCNVDFLSLNKTTTSLANSGSYNVNAEQEANSYVRAYQNLNFNISIYTAFPQNCFQMDSSQDPTFTNKYGNIYFCSYHGENRLEKFTLEFYCKIAHKDESQTLWSCGDNEVLTAGTRVNAGEILDWMKS